VFIYTCTNLSFSKTFPESLKKFKKGTKEDIIQWYKSARENERNMDDLEADDPYIDLLLMIIIWNDATRNIQKNNVIDGMSENNKNHLFYRISNYILISYPRI
jgi:hypothetical protein